MKFSQGFTPPPPRLSAWAIIGRIIVYGAGFAAMTLLALGWLGAFLHP